jgi:hypothetical protein
MDYNILENAFINVVTECNKINHKLVHDLEITLKIFEKSLNKSNPILINFLKDRYGTEFIKIKYTISQFPNLRSLHDKIYTKHLKYNRNIPSHITILFENFIKGITFFSNEIETTQPIYHRLYSCGPYDNNHRLGNLICTDNLSKTELKRRRPLIERCYIERLIYNELFIKESLHFPISGTQDNKQDIQHLFRMDLTETDFKTCFPDTSIKVEIDYEDNFPYKLIIIKTHKNIQTKLTYIKTYGIINNNNKIYEDLINCIKEENDKIYVKTCKFDNPGKFIKCLIK